MQSILQMLYITAKQNKQHTKHMFNVANHTKLIYCIKNFGRKIKNSNIHLKTS